MVPQLISMFKTSNKFKVFWLKVVFRGSNHLLGPFSVGNHKTNTF